MSEKRDLRAVKEKYTVWQPDVNLSLNPLAPNEKDLKRIVREFLFATSDLELIKIESYQYNYNPIEKKAYLTIDGLFERYNLKTKDFEVVRKVKKFVLYF
jgi:hypothetical protein